MMRSWVWAGRCPCWPPRGSGCAWSRSRTARHHIRNWIPKPSRGCGLRSRLPPVTCWGVQDIEVIRLGLPDTGLIACEDELAARLCELCTGFAVCLAPWEADAHAD